MKSDNLEQSLLLYAVTDRHWERKLNLFEQTKLALEGGATFVQIREKNLSYEEFKTEAEKLFSLCKEYNVPFVVNDNVKLAIEIDADGVHVGQSDMNSSEVRALIGKDKILGVSAQTVEQAVLAEKNGADYLGVGAVFKTSSKDDAAEVPFSVLKEICEAVKIPVVAIGGINSKNISELADSGIKGIAVISAIYGQKDILSSTKELKSLVKKVIQQ